MHIFYIFIIYFVYVYFVHVFFSQIYMPQVSKNKVMVEKHLSKLKKFSGISQHDKLKLYKTTILPFLIHTTVPLKSLTLPTKHKLQTTQNQSVRFVTNTDTFTNNSTLHKLVTSTQSTLSSTDKHYPSYMGHSHIGYAKGPTPAPTF